MMAPSGPTGLPTFHVPDQNLVAQAYEMAKQEAERIAKARAGVGGKGGFFSPPAPNGTMDWDASVPPGFKSSANVWICPSPLPGRLPFEQHVSHFWKSHRSPRGSSLLCLGPGKCVLCLGRDALFHSGRADDTEKAKKLGRARSAYFYQVLHLERPHVHVFEGVMRPLKWRVPTTLHQDLMTLFNRIGVANVINPLNGRAIFIEKSKDGPDDKDIKWSAPIPSDATRLPESFYPALHHLHDLTQMFPNPTQEDVARAVQEQGLPWTAEMQSLFYALPRAAAQNGPVVGPPPVMQAPPATHATAPPAPFGYYNQPPAGLPPAAAPQAFPGMTAPAPGYPAQPPATAPAWGPQPGPAPGGWGPPAGPPATGGYPPGYAPPAPAGPSGPPPANPNNPPFHAMSAAVAGNPPPGWAPQR